MKTDKLQHPEYLKVKQTARKELPCMFEKIPVGGELNYDFTNRDEFKATEVGDPFNYYSYNSSTFEKSTTVTVSVIGGNEFRALASLDYIKDLLHIVDFCASGLAKEIQAVFKRF